jgi:hypothetical protein
MMQGKVAGVVGVGSSMDVAQDAQCGLEAKKVLEGEVVIALNVEHFLSSRIGFCPQA